MSVWNKKNKKKIQDHFHEEQLDVFNIGNTIKKMTIDILKKKN